MSERPEAWYHLRASRADPRVPDRRRVYQAALQQAEELWVAARGAGPAGRPLPMFYFLAQAGRAVVAARGGDDVKVHGLTVPDPPSEVLRSVVGPTKDHGWFQAVAKSTGSPHLASPVALGALMASLPELAGLKGLHQEWLPAIRVWPGPLPADPFSSGLAQMTLVGEAPGTVILPNRLDDLAGLSAALKPYPDAAATRRTLQVSLTPAGRGYVLWWPRSDPSEDPLPSRYGGDEYRWMRPDLPTGDRPPSILTTWWAVLFTLSMLARYHPVEWAEALDVDRSPSAVILEKTMEVALEIVPQLVLEGIRAGPPDRAGGSRDGAATT